MIFKHRVILTDFRLYQAIFDNWLRVERTMALQLSTKLFLPRRKNPVIWKGIRPELQGFQTCLWLWRKPTYPSIQYLATFWSLIGQAFHELPVLGERSLHLWYTLQWSGLWKPTGKKYKIGSKNALKIMIESIKLWSLDPDKAAHLQFWKKKLLFEFFFSEIRQDA